MKANLFRQHGGPEVLEYSDFPTPEPKPGEVLVRLRAAALNRMDVMVRNGWPGLSWSCRTSMERMGRGRSWK